MTSSQCENCGQDSSEGLASRPAELFNSNLSGRSSGDLNICEKCVSYFDARSSTAIAVLNSIDKHRLIIAGPGCGKTYLFKEAVKTMPAGSKVLLLTFINNLKDDLEQELRHLALDDLGVTTTTRTLHSFEAAEFHRMHARWEHFPNLPVLVEDDAKILGLEHTEDDFNRSFANLEDTEARSFFLDRGTYYQAASFDDAGFRVLGQYITDPGRRPSYDLIIVDEYQDFNKLEAEFLQNIGEDNNMLIAGDDDQSIYGFKHASPIFLQELHSSRDSDYVAFELPHSGRCPAVVVAAVNAVIQKASEKGLLKGRIVKDFASYYPDKFDDDKKHPKIHRVNCTTPSVSWNYVASTIQTDSEGIDPADFSDSPEPYFLIVGSGLRKSELTGITDLLKAQLDPERFDIDGYEPPSDRREIELSMGYRLIEQNPDSNLGWRIVLYNDRHGCDLPTILKQTEAGDNLQDILPADYIDRHEKAANTSEGSIVDTSQELPSSDAPKFRVKVATHLGAKGLSAAHVFAIGLVNGVIPADPAGITDDELRQFLVSMTRTRKSLHLISHKVFVQGRGTIDLSSELLSLVPPDLVVKSQYKTADFK